MSPINVLIIPGLTLPTISERVLADIRTAAGADSTVTVSDYTEAQDHIAKADVVLGVVPPNLFAEAQALKWVQSISSGVDVFMYPEFINSPVMLTSEKGLVGEHLAGGDATHAGAPTHHHGHRPANVEPVFRPGGHARLRHRDGARVEQVGRERHDRQRVSGL